ncbi:NAD(P)H-dependent flavin oxidoreductase [Spongisporangium articulatum]|uniref:NAD(P)H-dependent flavin oxidoreductase n=1 Tax=Spongisporangium articulatum TaxID=3362603 RepID=A0ABW8ATR2_9ACTN
MSDWLRTPFCERFAVRYPIVQTGMGWVSGAHLTAATSAAGGLGILAAVTLDEDAMVGAVAKVRARTDAPFGVNLRPDQPDLPRRLDVLAESRVPVVSFAGGPPAAVIERVHAAGLLCVVTVGKPRHAEKMVDAGADALIAQGGEGGGHTGDIATTLLLPAVLDVVAGRVPVLAAGGFADGRGLAAALAWGADGVAMGTRFLLTRESRVPEAVKRRYLAAGLSDTLVSDAFDGMPMRVLRTEAVGDLTTRPLLRRLLEAPRQAAQVRRITGQSWLDVVREGLRLRRREGLSLERTARAAQAPLLIRSALVEGDDVRGLLPTGQVAGAITDLPGVAELIERIVAEARRAGVRFTGVESGVDA